MGQEAHRPQPMRKRNQQVTMTCHHMLKGKPRMRSSAGEEVEEMNHTAQQTLVKLSTRLSSDPAIVLLGTYPREIKTYVHTEIYTGMVTADYS